MEVQYQYFHDFTFQNRPDAARAILKKTNGEVEKIAYIHGAYSEDFSLERKLNKMLGIKLKRKRSS